jgi:hypothetical protein
MATEFEIVGDALVELRPYLKRGYVPYVRDVLLKLYSRAAGDYPEVEPKVERAPLHPELTGLGRALVAGALHDIKAERVPQRASATIYEQRQESGQYIDHVDPLFEGLLSTCAEADSKFRRGYDRIDWSK